MTLRGFIVTFFELLLVILALGTEIREFFVVAVCVGGVLAYSLLSLVLAMFTLSVASKVDKKTAERAERIKYSFSIHGIALLPITVYLSVKGVNDDFIPKKRKRRKKHSFMMVPSFSVLHKFTFEFSCKHVGMWDIGIKHLYFEDLFGLFTLPLLRGKKSDFIVKVAVIPKLHELERGEEKVSKGDYGITSLRNSEEGELLSDSRIYVAGDSLKRINWKLSARTKTLHSRQYEMPQKPKTLIITDKGILQEDMNDMIDITCETAISIARFFIERNNAVDIVAIREIEGSNNTIYSLRNLEGISKMQYDFATAIFYNTKDASQFSCLENLQHLNADRIYFITTNPSDQLLSECENFCKLDKVVRCIVPGQQAMSDVPDGKFDSQDAVRVDITSADQISEKVGAVM